MSATADIELEAVNVASVDRFQDTITKDGAAWDLTSGSVLATFHSPDGLSDFMRAMTPLTPASGVFYVDTLVTDILTLGWWRIALKVTDGTIVKHYPYRITFLAVDMR